VVNESNTAQSYQYQHSLHRKTRTALVTTALALIAEKGLSQTNMIEIADRARVSRASLYNHFRDKNEVFLAVVELEIERIFALAMREREVSARLQIISREISSHKSIATALSKDPSVIATLLERHEGELWSKIYQGLAAATSSDSMGTALVLRWIIGQVFIPLSKEHSIAQSDRLARAIS
jgi:AcrR family transcriptional regulator